MIPSTSPSQYVFMDQCWFCVCPSNVCVCVSVCQCPFYNTWKVFVQALQPPPAHPAPAGDISMGSKATTSHAGYKAVRKSSTTNPFQLCYVKTQVLLLTNVAHVIVRFCTFQLICQVWSDYVLDGIRHDHDIIACSCVRTCTASHTCADAACGLSKCIDGSLDCSGMFQFFALLNHFFAGSSARGFCKFQDEPSQHSGGDQSFDLSC